MIIRTNSGVAKRTIKEENLDEELLTLSPDRLRANHWHSVDVFTTERVPFLAAIFSVENKLLIITIKLNQSNLLIMMIRIGKFEKESFHVK